jgi:hypothetical protein
MAWILHIVQLLMPSQPQLPEIIVSASLDLIKAIRTGRLSEVQAVLDSGVPVEMHDGQGDPGLPLGIACFMGHVDIVRELVARGAKASFPDNSEPTSPLSLAIRGHRTEVVRALIELGAEIPPGTQTGLSEQEVAVARLKALHAAAEAAKPTRPAEDLPVFEEIEMVRCFGTDTAVLDADMVRAAREMGKKDKPA